MSSDAILAALFFSVLALKAAISHPMDSAADLRPQRVNSAQPSPVPKMPSDSRKGVSIALLGPPGSGKGTQVPQLEHSLVQCCSLFEAALLAKQYHSCHLSTGDLLRAEVRNGTPLGQKVHAAMERGRLVPDEIMLELVGRNIASAKCRNGFILDGFPRSLAQAEMLDQLLREQNRTLEAVFEFVIDDALLVSRISGRLFHPRSGRSYHERLNPPVRAMTDDITGEPLTRRKDDNGEVLRRRLEVYHKETGPLAQYYARLGILRSIETSLPIEKLLGQMDRAFNWSNVLDSIPLI